MSEYQVTWRGIFHDRGGYARAARGYVLALDRLGVDVRIEPVSFGTPAAVLPPAQSSRLGELAAKPRAEHGRRVLVIHLQPGTFDPRSERGRFDCVVGCMAWETTRLPAVWPLIANLYDALIGFSRQSLQAFAESGITAPLFCVPHGVDTDAFTADGPRAVIPHFNDQFKFLSVFRWDHRKAPEVLLRAFWEEFSAQDGVALVLKTDPGEPCGLSDRLALRDHIAELRRAFGFDASRAPVLVNVDTVPDAQLAQLYRSADVFVLPTRGEAAGLPFLEAMSCGLPVIATGWGGQTDFLNDRNSWLVEYDLEPTTSRRASAVAPFFHSLFTSEMSWAEPRGAHLRMLLRQACGDRAEVKQRGRQALDDARAMTWTSCAERLSSVLRGLVAG